MIAGLEDELNEKKRSDAVNAWFTSLSIEEREAIRRQHEKGVKKGATA